MTLLEPYPFLRKLFDAAVASAQPAEVLKNHLPNKPQGRCVVVGAGKASAAMAAALEAAWPDVPMSGVVVTRYGHAVATRKIKIIEASHPVPDENSLRAAAEVLQAVAGLSADDLVIALISGGGSSLLVSPLPGLTLVDKQNINRALLRSGAAIADMNTVRKHLSTIKGGKLAVAAAPARVVTLVISDVPGDDPAIIASGPTVADNTTPQDALAILTRFNINISDAVKTALQNLEAPKPISQPADVRMIASPALALAAAASVAKLAGVQPIILGDALEGEAAEVGKVLAGIALSAARAGHPVSPPVVFLSGGETSVTVRETNAGRGGRNMEFLLASALQLGGAANIYGLAADTDGIDGTEDAAGAWIGPETLSTAQARNVNAQDALTRHDSYSFFKALDQLIMTGPTLTNVNDFRALLVLPKS
jgi:glycerate 2-kinase